jgi:murein DD-endopeptidase MepM/ murein hydrolase activator NlpD
MKHIFITICSLLSIYTFAQNQQNDTFDFENYEIPNIVEFFNSYTNPHYQSNNLDTLNEETNKNTPFDFTSQKLHLDSIPDSIYIDCQDFCFPTESNYVTSRFGSRGSRYHRGIDIDLNKGDTVRTIFSGVVTKATFQHRGYGYYVVIQHDNGLQTISAHFTRNLVNEGDTLKAGDPIGLGGSTGRSTGSHLHFEILLFGNQFNPEKLIDFKNKTVKTIDSTHYFLHTNKETYSHRAQLEEMKRAAYHRVRSGETLSHIAKRYGTTVSRLCSLNRLKQTSVLQIGQKIRYR